MTEGKIDVLVVEDSALTRMFLVRLLESDPLIRVVSAVADGQAAIDYLHGSMPDVVLMDIHMRRQDGFETTRRIMETRPVPIVICSALASDTVFRALAAGAIACIEKPTGREHSSFEVVAGNLLQTVKLMSEVKVVRRWPRSQTGSAPSPTVSSRGRVAKASVKIIGIGASTGGPPVLQTILSGLQHDFPVPILVVQHIARGFLSGMAEWLGQSTGLPVHIGSCGTLPMPGHVYLAPDDYHMGIDASGHIILAREPTESGLRPTVAFLFRSLAEVRGANALGVLLTGMGKDGAAELKLMKDRGARTIAQDRASSIVHGMPGQAIALGGATYVLPADQIAQALVSSVGKSRIAKEEKS